MKQFTWFLLGPLVAGASAGCVERHFIVETDQPGAVVLVNGQQLGGQTPVDGTFDYYGKYRFTLIKDGFQTQQVLQDIAPPWFEYPGIDFFSENLWPFLIRDTRRFYYQMSPLQTPNIDDTSARALQLRNRAKTIGPTEPIPAAPTPPASPGVVTPPPVPNP
jgi:PEGA domain